MSVLNMIIFLVHPPRANLVPTSHTPGSTSHHTWFHLAPRLVTPRTTPRDTSRHGGTKSRHLAPCPTSCTWARGGSHRARGVTR